MAAPSQAKFEAWGTRQKLDKIMKYTEHKESDVRANACLALGLIDTPESANALIIMLRDPHVVVQKAAAQALGQLSYEQAKPHLRKLQSETQDPQLPTICDNAIKGIQSHSYA